MGSCCNPSTNNDQIDIYLEDAEKNEQKIIKLLLLGPGATGKSTLIKSLQMSHGNGVIPKKQRFSEIPMIRYNIAEAIQILIANSDRLYNVNSELYKNCKLNKNDSLTLEHLESLKAVKSPFYFEQNHENAIQLSKLAKSIEFLWQLPCIQTTYDNRINNFAIPDNLEHFLNQIDIIFDVKYNPSELDCLKARNRTSGVNFYQYSPDDMKRDENEFNDKNDVIFKQIWQVFDVGGQKNERRKWIHHFDSVNGLLFVGSLISYNCVLFEDHTMNSLYECCQLFEKITLLPTFANASLILILNKNDLLIDLLKKGKNENGLTQCFGKNNKNAIWKQCLKNSLKKETQNDNGNNNNTTESKKDENDENGEIDEKTDFASNLMLTDETMLERFESEFWDEKINEEYYPFNDQSKFDEFHEKVINFIKKLFKNRNHHNRKTFHYHISTAINSQIVFEIFAKIHMQTIMTRLTNIGQMNKRFSANNVNNVQFDINIKKNGNNIPTMDRGMVRSVSGSLEINHNNTNTDE